MRFHRKGVSMQVFSFLFALILIALILAYGAKTLVGVRKVSDDVELADFILRLRDQVNTMYSFDVGSSKQIDLFLPDAVEQVCFFNGGDKITAVGVDQMLQDFIDTNPGKNVLVMPMAFAEHVFLVEHLHVGTENPLCFSPQGKLRVVLETVLSDDGKVYVEVRRLNLI